MNDKQKASHVRATVKYNETNVKQIKINLNRKTDADIIEHLSQVDNIQGLLKDLIRKHMKEST